jgi:hypothetical protein
MGISPAMYRFFTALAVVSALAACSKNANVSVGAREPAVQTTSRSEPVFYNGKTYQLDYVYNGGQGAFDMKVSGLGPKQQKDAVNIATSALAYYACPNGQRGRLQGDPAYADGKWDLQAKCG